MTQSCAYIYTLKYAVSVITFILYWVLSQDFIHCNFGRNARVRLFLCPPPARQVVSKGDKTDYVYVLALFDQINYL